jgi:hypothetical protein
MGKKRPAVNAILFPAVPLSLPIRTGYFAHYPLRNRLPFSVSTIFSLNAVRYE